MNQGKSITKTVFDTLPAELHSSISLVLKALDRDAEEGKPVRGEMASELRDALAAPAPALAVDEELRQHILHMRTELTRINQKPISIRQRLAGKVTSLLNTATKAPATDAEDAKLFRWASTHGFPYCKHAIHPVEGEQYWTYDRLATSGYPTAKEAIQAEMLAAEVSEAV